MPWRKEATSCALGVVVEPEPPLLLELARLPTNPRFVLSADQLRHGRIPDSFAFTLLGLAVAEELREWFDSIYGAPDVGDRRWSDLIIAVGAAGGGVGRLCRALHVSRRAAYTWNAERDLPPPGALLREIRIESVELLHRAGLPRAEAVELAGWSDPKNFYAARSRRSAGRNGG